MTGSFVVLEGLDGAGTTTQARLLKERLGDRHAGSRHVIDLVVAGRGDHGRMEGANSRAGI